MHGNDIILARSLARSPDTKNAIGEIFLISVIFHLRIETEEVGRRRRI